MAKNNQPTNPDLILRDTLALESNQRTLLSFTRTGLYLIVTGLGVLYLKDAVFSQIAAWALIIFGVITAIVGFINYRKIAKKVKAAYG